MDQSGAAVATTAMNVPSMVESTDGKLRCLIMDCPRDENLDSYIEWMQRMTVSDLVHTCEPVYDTDRIEAVGISCHGLIFGDGQNPPDEIIDEWMDIINRAVKSKTTVAVHCVAGLGRAPVLVAIALIERGMDQLEAITYVRDKRKGAINKKQLAYLKNYKRRGKGAGGCCSIQ
eukprot:Selendium_serpulae@DN5842_c0_g1_i1.p1